jgi:hypothetical protein
MAAITWPDWQYPHCATFCATQAACTAVATGSATPSMVVIAFPPSAPTGVMHARVGTPSTCTVQAPQSAMPHPKVVPVRPSDWRSAQRSGISAGTSSDCAVPLTVSVMGVVMSRIPWGGGAAATAVACR